MDADPHLLPTPTRPRQASPKPVAQERNVIEFPSRRRRRAVGRLARWVDALLVLFSANAFDPKAREKALPRRSADIVRFRRDPFRQSRG